MSNNFYKKLSNKHYIISFWITLSAALGLIIGGFFVPPKGIIDGSVMTSVGLLFLWPALSSLVIAVDVGRVAKLNFGHNSVSIGRDCDNNGYDDDYEMENPES